jgi:hypothetical protein
VARSAQRCAKDAATNLLPPEFAKRYRQQFVDGLWMRGVFAVLSLYIVGVLIYFGALYALKLKFNHVKTNLASISPTTPTPEGQRPTANPQGPRRNSNSPLWIAISRGRTPARKRHHRDLLFRPQKT